MTEEVELVVVDGASTDNTGNIVRRYAEVCKQINYIRLPAKGGVDQDYCIAVEHAKGEMCWLFPDDDLLKPGAVRTVLEEVKRIQPDRCECPGNEQGLFEDHGK